MSEMTSRQEEKRKEGRWGDQKRKREEKGAGCTAVGKSDVCGGEKFNLS